VNINLQNSIDLTEIHVDELVYKEGGTLRLHGWILPVSDGSLYSSKREFGMAEGLDKRALSAASQLLILAPEGSILDPNSPFFTAFVKNIGQIVSYSKNVDGLGLQSAISTLVGLGGGSTPSGDDFLGGFLFCLRQLGSENGCLAATFEIDDKTSWFSRKFVDYAKRGFVIEPLENFTNSILSGTEESVTTSIFDLVRIGHSSGIDSAVGVLIATTLGKDDTYCDSLLKKLNIHS